jgi:hypothetical protein
MGGDRGYIYIVGCAHSGMRILQHTGPARAIAALKQICRPGIPSRRAGDSYPIKG